MTEYTLRHDQIVKRLSIVLFVLLLANMAVLYSIHFLGHKRLWGLVSLFNFNSEHNIPTLFSVFLILLNSLLFFHLYRMAPMAKSNRTFFLLSAIFVFLAFDEFFSVHEKLILPMREMLGAGGYLYFTWLVPYLVIVALLALYLLPFLMRLPTRVRNLYLLSGFLYITGAMVIEMFEGKHYEQYGADLVFHTYTTVEELLEMFAMILCLYTSLAFAGDISLRFPASPTLRNPDK